MEEVLNCFVQQNFLKKIEKNASGRNRMRLKETMNKKILTRKVNEFRKKIR